jgi:uncharacterized membrane protein YhaH (DUF805 family)
MNFREAVESGIHNYTNFSGRARRSEFWFFALFTGVSVSVFGLMGSMILGSPMLYILGYLALAVPSLSAGVRRMHDIDRSGWTLLYSLIPILGALYVLYLEVQPGTEGANQFGADPKDGQEVHMAVAA